MLEKQINYKGLPLYYTVSGKGKAVVLLHGFGEGPGIWMHQFKALKDYTVIVPSLPGTGKSVIAENMSMEELAHAVHAVVRAEGVKKFVLLGHSMGGYITLAYAAAYPTYLAGFGLIHSTAFSDTEEKKETRRKGIEFINKNGGGAFLKTTIPSLYAPVTKQQNPGLVEQHIAEAQRFNDAALIQYYESMIMRPDRTAILKTTDVPVLFVAGRWDAAVPLEDVLKQAKLPQISYIHILENSGHMGMVEEPEALHSIVSAFVDYINKKE